MLKVLTANVRSANNNHAWFLDYVRREQPDVVVVVEAYRYWMQSFESLAPQYRVAGGCALLHECDVVILTTLAPGRDQPPPQSARVLASLILPEELGGATFQVLGLHLSRPKPGATLRPDLDEAIAAAQKLGPMDIVAGDFNATPWGAALRRFDTNVPVARHTRWLPTWPATLESWDLEGLVPVAPIDHIYAGESWRLIDIKRGPDIGSDHYPVLATFSLEHR
jgi:endonuclease/exonuclease/phosphatase (EEP) superfamily protein YafD